MTIQAKFVSYCVTMQILIPVTFRQAVDYFSAEMPPRTEKLLAEIKAWCDQERGRQSELARFLGTSRQAVSDWFKPEKKKSPTAEQALAMLEFLKQQRTRK